MELKPSEAMIAAAKRGLALSTDAAIDPITKSTASLIAAGDDITAAHVQHMASAFLSNTFEREAGWELTDPGLHHILLGGDAGKAWVVARTKELATSGMSLDEAKQDFAELFFADTELSDVKADPEGLIWKPMLPVGIWKIGPNGRPLKVIAGHSKDQRKEIGMQDVIEAFNANAVPHVTVPLSHEDRVDENAGYLRKLKVATHNGVKTLFGGHHFTDKKIGGKVMDGSIANTSVGLEFDYVRKDDGKKFPIVLRHNALTNRPWLGRKLAPFGLAEEEADHYLVMCGEYSEAIVEEGEEVATDPTDDKSTSGEAGTIQSSEVVDATTTNKEPVMAKEDEKEKVTPATPAPTVELSDHPDFIAEREKNARLAAQVAQLSTDARKRDAEDFIGELKAMGFTEDKGCTGFLKETKNVLLADEGETALLLSEDGKAAPSAITVTGVLRKLFSTLPGKDGKAPIATLLSEQASDPLGIATGEKPPAEPDEKDLENMTLSEKEAAADAWFEENYPGAKKSTTTTKEA